MPRPAAGGAEQTLLSSGGGDRNAVFDLPVIDLVAIEHRVSSVK